MSRRERKPDTTAMAEDTEIEVSHSSINGALIFHIIYDVLAFLLYMHQQIPSMLQDMTLQFDALQTEYKESDILLGQSIFNASSRRKCIGRKRDVKLEIRRIEKMMNTISNLQTALMDLIREVPYVENIIFAFGGTPRRPQHVYQILFPRKRIAPLATEDMNRNKMIEMLSRKVIQTLISKGVGTVSYPGPTKFFLLVKAPTSFNMPWHFLPKRDFQFSKKIMSFRLQLRSRTPRNELEASCVSEEVTNPNDNNHICPNLTWFQCRHVIKGIALGNPTPEE